MMRRPKVVLFYETHEHAAAIRVAVGQHEGLFEAIDLPSLKRLLAVHGDVDAIVAEYGGESARPLAALAVAARIGRVPRRILMTPRRVTAGVTEAVYSGNATCVLNLPCAKTALRSAVYAPPPGIWRPRAA